jgi:hypothetical protein
MAFTLLKRAIASIATPSAGKVTVFVDSASGQPYMKDDAGTATTLVGATGATGAAGINGDESLFWMQSTPGAAAVAAAGAAIPGAWTAFTPAWTAASSNPTLGDGTLTGAYVQIGKTVHFRIALTFGSTTTGGSGFWYFGFPVTAVALATNHGILCNGYVENIATSGHAIIVAEAVDTTKMAPMFSSDLTSFPGAASNMSGVAPFTFGVGDFARFSGTYEAA